MNFDFTRIILSIYPQNRNRTLPILFFNLFLGLTCLFPQEAFAVDVAKWKRFEVSYTNSSFSGNPFDLEFSGTFTHTLSKRKITQLGFYAGNNTWKLYFMPDATGEWTYTTNSADPDLDGMAGSLNCITSNLPGKLVPQDNRWKLTESNKYDIPIMIPTRQWFKSTNTQDGIGDFINWAKNTVGARIIGTTLVYFTHEQAASPYIKGKEGEEFNIAMWDRINSHLDAMRDSGIGFYIMFYSDDLESPNLYGITAQSAAELRLLRYAVARFSAYPMIIWDTGIDIAEARTNTWIDWFANWFNTNDPYQHPVSSRTGGGSGGKNPANATYTSDGADTLPSHTTYVNTWKNTGIPSIFTDRWREDGTRGGFDQTKIRRAVWEMGLVGGTGLYISGNDNGGYLTDTYAADFKAAPEVGHAAKFFRNDLNNFGALAPHDELVISGNMVLAAVPGIEYVGYMSAGGSVSIALANTEIAYKARWYNPRTAEFQTIGIIPGGSNVDFTSPTTDDWVLHLAQDQSIGVPGVTTGINIQVIPKPK